MGLHHLLLSRTASNFSFVLFQAVEDFVILWFVLCHHPSKLVSLEQDKGKVTGR